MSISRYKIMSKGHEGVASVEGHVFGYVEANSEIEALHYYAEFDPSVKWIESWQCYCYGARKIFAVKEANLWPSED